MASPEGWLKCKAPLTPVTVVAGNQEVGAAVCVRVASRLPSRPPKSTAAQESVVIDFANKYTLSSQLRHRFWAD
jgi:hypothetical protein